MMHSPPNSLRAKYFAIQLINLMKISYRKKGLCLALLVLSSLASAQTSVTLAPIPLFQSFLQSGRPNAFGCVFTYQSNTVTPLGTYTDATGNTLNANPVALSSSGSANIWIKVGQAYGFTIKASGGTNCSSGSIVASVQGIGGGASILTTAVPFSATPTFTDQSQNQLFTMTLTGNATALPLAVVGVTPPGYITFQITQDNVGAHTFTWPPNMVGGAPIGLTANQITTQEFLWNGTTAIALGPAVTGSGPSLSTGAIASTGNISTSGTVVGGSFPSPVITTPSINGVTIQNSPGAYIVLPNAGTMGTTLNTLTKLSAAPSTALIAATTDTGGVVGITVLGAGITANATIQQSGTASCVFDGATTAGDYVQISATTAGNCHDAGASYPTQGQLIGRVLSTNGGGGTYSLDLFGPEVTPTFMQLYTSGGSLQPGPNKIVTSGAALITGTRTFTLSGNAIFVNIPVCMANDNDATNAVQVVVNSVSSITTNGTGTDHITLVCFGH